MSGRAKWEYLKSIYARYEQASKMGKRLMLNEFCRVCGYPVPHATRAGERMLAAQGYHRKHAIRKLNGPVPTDKPENRQRVRRETYGKQSHHILQAVWEAAGYPWSVRLKALLRLWLPWIKQRFKMSAAVEQQLLAISARQIDRVLAPHKRKLSKRIYGRTKPGTLLKPHMPIRTANGDVKQPGFVEIDLVSHSGNSADDEFIFSLNLTDIYSGWVETRALMGKGQRGVVAMLDDMVTNLPFALCATGTVPAALTATTAVSLSTITC